MQLREDRAAVDRAIPALQAAWDAAGDPRGRRSPGLTGEELAAVIGLTDEAELADPWVQVRGGGLGDIVIDIVDGEGGG